MAKTVVITQSNYIPWRGYFDLLRSADEVVLLDSVQYTRRDWRNRKRRRRSPKGKAGDWCIFFARLTRDALRRGKPLLET